MRGGPGAPLGSSPPTHCCEQHRRGPWPARQRYWRANFWSGLRGGVREAAADLGVLCGGTQLPRVYRTPRSAHPPLFLPTKQPRPRRTKVSVTERSQFRLCKRGSSQLLRVLTRIAAVAESRASQSWLANSPSCFGPVAPHLHRRMALVIPPTPFHF